MAFKNYEVEEDEIMCAEADPVLNKLNRKAGANVLQDMYSNTHYGKVGDTKHPFVLDKIRSEVKNNMMTMLYQGRMTYSEMEETLVNYGYNTGIIRSAFEEVTGVNPEKLEHMRLEQMKDIPANIPGFNLGWGLSKGAKGGSYFIMNGNNVFTVFHQMDDMHREECQGFLRHDEAIKHLASLVKEVVRYDTPAKEAAEDYKVHKETVSSKGYERVANYLYSLGKTAQLNAVSADRTIVSAITNGIISREEGDRLFSVYAAGNEIDSPGHVEETDRIKDNDLDDKQDERVADVMKKRTPQQMFTDSLPDRDDEIVSEHTKNVFSYIKNRNSDIQEFDINVKKFVYEKHDVEKAMVTTHPQTGKPTGPAKATASTVLEIKDNTLPEGKNIKFALAVFFVGSDGEVTTSDSVKGEDDLIYGFTDDGLSQYFRKNRENSAA